MERNIFFNGNSLRELDGQGLVWNDGTTAKHLIMREGSLWANTSLNFNGGLAVNFNNTLALSQNELGTTVVKSNLKQVGNLKFLTVDGKTSLGKVVTVDPDFQRVGINTEKPNAALSIVDNSIEIILGSHQNDIAKVGTYTADDLALITDNTERIKIGRTGEIVIGHAKHKNAVVTINGKLVVDQLETKTKLNKSLELSAPAWDVEPNGLGIVWTGASQHKFTFESNIDRFHSSENIDLAQEKYFSIENTLVLSKTALGSTVVDSNLTTLGLLKTVRVSGKAVFMDSHAEFNNEGLSFKDRDNAVIFNHNGIASTNKFSIEVDRESEFEIDRYGNITVGNRHNNNRVVAVFGQLSIGMRHPDPTVSLVTAGTMSFAGKKFVVGDNFPSAGVFNKGDICWNTDPKISDYIGWVCIVPGTPGKWEPFGPIGR